MGDFLRLREYPILPDENCTKNFGIRSHVFIIIIGLFDNNVVTDGHELTKWIKIP